ncbi:hypothetical protein KIM322_13820 [Lactobacillus xylocopicola]|uniref:Transposase n=1 Tax=Lactobacillus xylocopicola TaxID=2976676 RepID=A0ABM8BII4_9LACO|nr:hypothetical protein KIM322_13820 [Lactobacillus xylocopicola]
MQKYERFEAFIVLFIKQAFRFLENIGIVRFLNKNVVERLGIIHVCVSI